MSEEETKSTDLLILPNADLGGFLAALHEANNATLELKLRESRDAADTRTQTHLQRQHAACTER